MKVRKMTAWAGAAILATGAMAMGAPVAAANADAGDGGVLIEARLADDTPDDPVTEPDPADDPDPSGDPDPSEGPGPSEDPDPSEKPDLSEKPDPSE